MTQHHRGALLLTCLLTWVSGIAQNKPLVVSTASMINDIARNVGGGLFEYQMIVPIGGDPHIYEPTPSDAQLCGKADLILKNGLTFEGWISSLIDNAGSKAPVITVTNGVDPIQSTLYANATDPHAWMDASNGILYAKNISDAMRQLMPAHAETFSRNYEAYKVKLESLDNYMIERIRAIPENKRILITSHDAFHYYGRRYGLRLESILGTSTDVDVRTADIRRLNEVIRTSEVPVVFVESTINPKMLEQIASDNGIAVGGKLYADSLGDPNGPAGTYIDMLRYNTETIYDGLTQERSALVNANGSDKGQSWLWAFLLAPVILIVIFFIVRAIRT